MKVGFFIGIPQITFPRINSVNIRVYLFVIIIIFSTYRPKILLTQPFDTWSMRDISHGRAPEWASSTIF